MAGPGGRMEGIVTSSPQSDRSEQPRRDFAIRAKTKGARPSLCPQPGTLRPNPPKAPAPAHCGLDQSANSDTCDRRNPTLNSDATCLKLVDTFRVTTRDKCRGDFKHALNTLDRKSTRLNSS